MITELFADRKTPYTYNKELISQAKELNIQLNNAKNRFNQATDSFDIEASIYRLKELEMEYSSLLNRAKLEKICCIMQFGSVRL